MFDMKFGNDLLLTDKSFVHIKAKRSGATFGVHLISFLYRKNPVFVKT